MSELIRKLYPSKIKQTSQERVLDFVITTETKDRDGEVVKAEGGIYDNYIKNPVVLWAHDYQSLPVGKTIEMKRQGTKTIASVEFPTKDEYEYADIVYKLCKGGYLNTVSIGFIPHKFVNGANEKEPSRTYTEWELLEFSIVPVPSNPDALVSAREAGVITVKEFNALKKSSFDKESLLDAIATAEIVDLTETESDDNKEIVIIGNRKHKMTQAELKDEIDFLSVSIADIGINSDNTEVAVKLAQTILRETGNDIPDDEIKTPDNMRDRLNPVVKMLSDHHEAHNLCYTKVAECLKGMVETPDKPLDEKPLEEEKPEDDKKMIMELIKQETKKQLMEVKK